MILGGLAIRRVAQAGFVTVRGVTVAKTVVSLALLSTWWGGAPATCCQSCARLPVTPAATGALSHARAEPPDL
jgi:hypothetical protein